MALTSTARAQSYGMAGCGLGSLLIKDNTTLMQVIAATLNGTGYQTFGITSGTSNCTSGGVVKAQREQAAFAEVNFQDLKRNMATGGGEFLTSFSSLLGCEESAKPVLAKMTQDQVRENPADRGDVARSARREREVADQGDARPGWFLLR